MTTHAPALYTAEMATAMQPRAGEAYQPSNGMEGEMFMERWCMLCAKDNIDPDTGDGGCSIIADTMALTVGDPDYPKDWVISAEGQPVCTAFCARGTEVDPDAVEHDPNTLEMDL